MSDCYLCHKPTDVDGTDTDWCMAERILAGVKDIVPVHRDCIDGHDRREAMKAFLNSSKAITGGKTFNEWYGR